MVASTLPVNMVSTTAYITDICPLCLLLKFTDLLKTSWLVKLVEKLPLSLHYSLFRLVIAYLVPIM